MAILAGLMVLFMLMLGMYNLGGGKPFFSLPSASAKVQEGYYELFGPEGFTVNLNDRSQRRYLKTGVVIAYQEKNLLKELESRQSQLRDLTITVLRRWSATDLAEEEGIEKLRTELLSETNAVLTSGEAKDIYFTEFIVQ